MAIISSVQALQEPEKPLTSVLGSSCGLSSTRASLEQSQPHSGLPARGHAKGHLAAPDLAPLSHFTGPFPCTAGWLSSSVAENTRQQFSIYDAHLKNLVIKVEHSSCQACIQLRHLPYKLVTVEKELSPNTSCTYHLWPPVSQGLSKSREKQRQVGEKQRWRT